MWPWDHGYMDASWGIAMMLTLTIWVLIAVGIIILVAQSTRTTVGPPSEASGAANVTSTAEQILAERLARGEIDSEEYRSRLDALASPRT